MTAKSRKHSCTVNFFLIFSTLRRRTFATLESIWGLKSGSKKIDASGELSGGVYSVKRKELASKMI